MARVRQSDDLPTVEVPDLPTVAARPTPVLPLDAAIEIEPEPGPVREPVVSLTVRVRESVLDRLDEYQTVLRRKRRRTTRQALVETAIDQFLQKNGM